MIAVIDYGRGNLFSLSSALNFLGCKFPIIGGAMTWVSEKNLVSAISNAGGLGVIACGAMEPSHLENEIISTQKLTKNPIGVNLILMHPKIEKLIEICIENKIQFIVFAGGIPKKKYINQFKAEGIKTIAFASTLFIANRLKNFGIDALIIEGSEAGGHIGPVSTNVLAQEILPFISEIPIFVAGGIGRGESFLNYLRQGAAGCQIGTRFVCAHESQAHQNFKDIFIKFALNNFCVKSFTDLCSFFFFVNVCLRIQ